MSFLHIIPQVWADGARMLASFLREAFGPTSLSRSETTEALLLAGDFKEPQPSILTREAHRDGRSRPAWMTRGITPLNAYETHSEPFPPFDALPPLDEIHAMHAAHLYTGLAPSPRPMFLPDLTWLDTKRAMRIDQDTPEDIFIHEVEASDALAAALKLAHSDMRSPYSVYHPAFTPPRTLPKTASSPLTSVIAEYISDTHARCSHGIRAASPAQIRTELETCLMLAFAPYVTCDAFLDAQGRHTIFPRFLTRVVEDCARPDKGCLARTWDVIECCEVLRVEGAEGLLEIWDAWRWVVRCYVGVLVLRDRARRKEDVIWL